MNQEKTPPAAEVSLKYLAWSIKEMAESLKKLVALLSEIREMREKGSKSPLDREMPF